MDPDQNPFIEALQSDSLNQLLQNKDKRELAEKLVVNLKKLSEMFVKLSDSEKQQFVNEFKGQFVNQLKALTGIVEQQNIVNENSEAQTLIPQFNVAGAFQEEMNFYLTISFVMLVLLFVVFFGYKLYLSLTEKERKREEKLKAKQAKKKK
ncbi:uncharacterized protein LOC131690291 isoform X1 [Topomyia yanbarensis]|uniref:uncharacterized protein LOC131690291 isoform X1 n=1 Tax=Topomyia yanbarensis TaxID=2498891 RepID=UPI00273C707F|nr:uncharacterized protein LOC131690291 isoform X1 [Topomyia yanbarensis]